MVNETNASATMTSNERTARAMADNATAVYPDRHLYNGRRSFVTDLEPRPTGMAADASARARGFDIEGPDRAPAVAVSVSSQTHSESLLQGRLTFYILE